MTLVSSKQDGVSGSTSRENLGQSEHMENVEKNETDIGKLGKKEDNYIENQVSNKMRQLEIYQIHIFGWVSLCHKNKSEIFVF